MSNRISKFKGLNPLKKIQVFWNGLVYILINDLSVTNIVLLSAVVLGFSAFLLPPVNFLIILIATASVVSMEMMNSCVEMLCNLFTTEYDERIKAIKDVAATATGITILSWTLVIIIEVYRLIELYI